MKLHYSFLFFALLFSCRQGPNGQVANRPSVSDGKDCRLIILGTLQDGGSPHAGCLKSCCKKLFSAPDQNRKVVSLGVIDPIEKKYWLIEATPDISSQMMELKNKAGFEHEVAPDGIFLTHAHIGHYAGLMYLGREAMSSKKVPVYAMPRMKTFLQNNGPWSQLLTLENISLVDLADGKPLSLTASVRITPFTVPHRDEFSETIGYIVEGPAKKALFIPDIDKWTKWNKNIIDEIKKVDYAFIDGTFYSADEIPGRNLSEIPHPLVIESAKMFESLSVSEKGKIYFVHFNHSNPLLDRKSHEAESVTDKGFHLAKKGEMFNL